MCVLRGAHLPRVDVLPGYEGEGVGVDIKLFFPIDDPKRIVLRNPIARAVAAQRLATQIRKFAVGLYMLDAGDDVTTESEQAGTVIFSVLMSLQDMGLGGEPDVGVLRAGANILNELAEGGFTWRPIYAVTLDRCLQICAARYPKIPSSVLYTTYDRMAKGEAKALMDAVRAKRVPA